MTVFTFLILRCINVLINITGSCHSLLIMMMLTFVLFISDSILFVKDCFFVIIINVNIYPHILLVQIAVTVNVFDIML